MHLSRGRCDRLLFQIDADAPCALAVLDFHRERIYDWLVDHDRENSVLEAVGEEDIAKARADDGADSHFLKRPHRAFPRRSAAEVRSRNQDFGVPIGLAVQDELRVLRSIRQIAQRTERPFAERAANGITDQTFDANDNVGIDITAHDWSCDRVELVKRLWHLSLHR